MKKENLGHLMVDIETLGNSSNSVICSIAAIEFDLATGETGRSFNKNISIQSCLDFGLKVDGSTIKWWFEQDKLAQIKLFKDAESLNFVLRRFFKFILELCCPGTDHSSHGYKLFKSDLQIWGNSNRFDLGILENAYKAVGIDVPWMHWNERDVRTLVSFAPEIKKNMSFEGIKHDPIADCIHQIKYCSATYKYCKS